MNTFLLLLILIAATIILVFIHELGHFIFAKINGVHVAEFSVGFGPKLYSKYYKGTWYSLRALPFGGYVSILTKSTIKKLEDVKVMLEKDPNSKDEIEKGIFPYDLNTDYNQLKSYEKSSFIGKSAIILSGVMFNFLFSMIILASTYSNIGLKQNSDDVSLRSLNATATNFDDDLNTSYETMLLQNSLIHFITTDEELNKTISDSLSNNNLNYDSIDSYCDFECYRGYEDVFDIFLQEVSVDTTYYMYYSPTYSFSLNYISIWIRDSVITAQDYLKFIDATKDWERKDYEVFYENLLANGETDKFNFEFTSFQKTSKNEEDSVIEISEESYVYNPSLQKDQYWYLVEIDVVKGESLSSAIDKSYVLRDVYSYNELKGWENFSASFVNTFTNMINPWIDIFSDSDPSVTYVGEEYIGEDGQTNSRYGYAQFNSSLAVLSSLLILFNIIPIPPLDGYKFFESAYEKARGQDISIETKSKLDKIGWMIIAAITLLLFFVPFFIY